MHRLHEKKSVFYCEIREETKELLDLREKQHRACFFYENNKRKADFFDARSV